MSSQFIKYLDSFVLLKKFHEENRTIRKSVFPINQQPLSLNIIREYGKFMKTLWETERKSLDRQSDEIIKYLILKAWKESVWEIIKNYINDVYTMTKSFYTKCVSYLLKKIKKNTRERIFACNLHNQFLYNSECRERERKKMTVSPERKEIFDLSMQSLEKKSRKSQSIIVFSTRLFTLSFR